MHQEGDGGIGGPERAPAANQGPSLRPQAESGPSGEAEGAEPRGDGTGQKKSGKSRRRRGRRGKGRGKAAPAAARAEKAETAPPPASGPSTRSSSRPNAREDKLYAALDLGTNNCRLLVARRAPEGFKVVDAYSRIVRLGEGLATTGALGEAAMARAIDALNICAEKMKRRGVNRARTIATAACRTASNGPDFIARVKRETGLSLEIVSTEDEARLAVAGCAPLLDADCASALVFDIGGGSTELIWVRLENSGNGKCRPVIGDWISLPCGVVTLAERHGGVDVPVNVYGNMVQEVADHLAPFLGRLREERDSRRPFHLLGTSGTVTTIAGVHLGLERYDRSRVDGIWISPTEVHRVTRSLLDMDYRQRAAHPCVGQERADLVLAGCAIFEAIADAWPAERLRVADRGLREGILMSLMDTDANRRKRRRRHKSKRGAARTEANA
ncbi:Ppx/GppA phosphatase family protein [Parvibaculum sp.]|uniref:Ppx/GppA phosphatase family protein n=1 Tax=Parvibaculum sp. TaxID=2024848 RepID=UPI003918E342